MINHDLKVVYDPQIFSGQIYGGVSRYFCEIASRISSTPDVSVKITAPMYVNAYLENLPNSILTGFKSPLPYEFLRLYQRVASLFFGDIMLRCMMPNIVHETYYFKYPLGSKRAARVLTIYDMIHEKFASQFQYGDKTAIHKKAAAHRADHIICISESTKRDAIEILGIKPEKISVIYLGFDLMTGKTDKVNLSLNVTDKPYLMYVGSRGGYKNFKLMLEAYATSKKLKSGFNLVCFGGGAFNIEELALINRLKINTNQIIQISGNDELLAKFYRGASAFIFPSLYEGFGIPPLEAMSYDCPVVCSNTSSIPEVVGNAGQYFDPYDISSIQSAIEVVVESNELKKSLIEKGKEQLNYFSWDKCAEETLHVYKNLM